MVDYYVPEGKGWARAGWDTGLAAERLAQAMPGVALEVLEFHGERTIVVPEEQIYDVLAFLRDDAELAFDFLTDLTAVHWPERPKPFEVVYLLYSFPRNARLRIKTSVGPEPRVPSVVSLWSGAAWMERECYDMFGVIFEGHPDLRRILMPEDFDAYPLRKDYPLKA